MCMIEAESLDSVFSMHRNNVKATYFHLLARSEVVSRQGANGQIRGDHHPLGISPDGAELLHREWRETEATSSSGASCNWDVEVLLPADRDAAYYCLMEAIADRFPSVVPPYHVWGFGRQLWNRAFRVHGKHPLGVFLLGPAAVGKTSVGIRIAERFGLLHINAGDLLFDEVCVIMVPKLVFGDVCEVRVRLRYCCQCFDILLSGTGHIRTPFFVLP